MFVSDKMKTINRTVSPDVSNHIYLDFGDGLMGGIECNQKKKTNKIFMCICVHIASYTDAILFVVRVRSEIQENYEGISALQL